MYALLGVVAAVGIAAVGATAALGAPAAAIAGIVAPAASADPTGAGGPFDGAVPAGGAALAVAFARSQLGSPYLWGGTGAGGWDCSGLVQAAYATVGLHLPRVAADQFAATATRPVALDAVEPGDLVFFGPSYAGIDHVGIAVSPTEMIDAPHTGAVVRVEPFAWSDLLAATRPLPVGQ